MKISTHFDIYKFSFTLNYGPLQFYHFNFVPVAVQPLKPDTVRFTRPTIGWDSQTILQTNTLEKGY